VEADLALSGRGIRGLAERAGPAEAKAGGVKIAEICKEEAYYC